MAKTVYAFYYGWYTGQNWASPVKSGHIQSALNPYLGQYDSRNANVLADHMYWAKAAGIDVLVCSWWGPNDFTNVTLPLILNAAHAQGIKVTVHLEPYGGRTASSLASDIAYILTTYSAHPAFFQIARATKYGPSTALRPVFFIYTPPAGMDFAVIRPSIDALYLTRTNDALVYTDAGIRSLIDGVHADGVYNYGAWAQPNPMAANGIPLVNPDYYAVFGVSPGFDNSYSVSPAGTTIGRAAGATYDAGWYEAHRQMAEAVGIVSFNEWRESSVIEPATGSFDGAWGLTGDAAAAAYITHTAGWASIFKR